jgi:hypothetical protein
VLLYGVAFLQRPGRFWVNPMSLIQKFAVPAVPGPAVSSKQSTGTLSVALLYEIVFEAGS